jgi:hypothetical protein
MRDLRLAVLLILAALAVLYAAPAAAQTPDGLPPALETVCDMETGAAFGWCNAYCEAMDCELANDGDPLTEPNASATACSKVRTKFQQQTGRDMPCEVSCPCTDNPEMFPVWSFYLAGELTAFECAQDGQFCDFAGAPPELCSPPQGDVTFIVGDLPDGTFGVAASSLGLPELGNPSPFCGDTVGDLLPLSPEQGVVCKQQLDAALAASGLICGGITPP